MYGSADALVVTEESPLDPKTEYARSKVKAERAITAMASQEFFAGVHPQRHDLRRVAAHEI